MVDDGDLVTAGGVTYSLDLTLWLIERYLSPQIAHKVEREMEDERRGIVWRCLTGKKHNRSDKLPKL